MIYFIILLGLLALSYRYDYCQIVSGKKFWLLITFLALILVAGLRFRIGTDSIRYESYFTKEIPTIWELRSNYFLKIRFEPGFVILMSLCRSISSDFTVFQFVHTIILNTAVFLFFLKNTRHIFFGLLLYCLILYVPLNFEVLRESLAIAMFLFAWPFYKKNNFLVYYLLILLAMTFHIGSSVCLICPLFMVPGINWLFSLGKRTIFICLAILVVGLMVNMLFFKFVKMLEFSATLADRATAYSKNELSGMTLNLFGAIGVTLRWAVYPCLSMLFYRRNISASDKETWSDMRHVEAMTLFSVYIGILTIPISLFYRFNNYFYFFSILSMSMAVYEIVKVRKRRFRLSFLYWMIVFMPLFVLQVKGQMAPVNFSGRLKAYMTYYPYSSRLNPEEDRDREAVFRYYRSW